jgi:hypothetical protein
MPTVQTPVDEDDDTFMIASTSSTANDDPPPPAPAVVFHTPKADDLELTEHSVLFVSPLSLFLFRTTFLLVLACALASLGSLWWVYSGGKDGIVFEGGLTLGDVRMMSSPSLAETVLVQFQDAVGSLGVFSGPMIAAGVLVSVGIILICFGYVVNLATNSIVKKLLLLDPFCSARPLVPAASACEAQPKQQWLLEEDDRIIMLAGLEKWRHQPTPTLSQLNATARFATAGALCFACAVLTAMIPCLAFDWVCVPAATG